MSNALSCRALAKAVKKPNYIQLCTCDIQGVAKKTPVQKFQYLQNGVILLCEIFSDYYGVNVLCNIMQVCGNGATFGRFGFQCIIFK